MSERKRTKIDTLSQKQLAALPFFIAAQSIEAACKSAKVSRTVFYSWLQQDVFRAELEKLRAQAITDALAYLKNGIAGAVEKLLTLLESKEESIRLRSAQAVIDYYLKVVNAEEIERRLTMLETAINSKGIKPWTQ